MKCRVSQTMGKDNDLHNSTSTLKPLMTDQAEIVSLFVGCSTSQQHASVSQGRICSDSCTCCHTETEVADQTFYLTQSQYTDTGWTSPSADPITTVTVHGMTRPKKNPGASGIRTRDLPLLRRTPEPLGQRGSRSSRKAYS